MKAKITPSVIVLAGTFVFAGLSAKAAPPPEQNGNYKYEVNNSGANLGLFKLFTIQPQKKEDKKNYIAPPKTEKKVAEPSYADRMRKLL